jgi:hypothetical protein
LDLKKCLGWIWIQGSNRSGGSRARSARHMKRSKKYQGRRGLGCKTTLSSTSGQTSHRRTGGRRRRPWWPWAPALRRTRGSIEAQNRKRRSRRTRWGAHLEWRTTAAAGIRGQPWRAPFGLGFRRAAARGVLAVWRRSPAQAGRRARARRAAPGAALIGARARGARRARPGRWRPWLFRPLADGPYAARRAGAGA